jgi:hypothetical protein
VQPVVQKQMYKSLTVVHKQLYSLTENAKESVILCSGTEASITPGRCTEASVILAEAQNHVILGKGTESSLILAEAQNHVILGKGRETSISLAEAQKHVEYLAEGQKQV